MKTYTQYLARIYQARSKARSLWFRIAEVIMISLWLIPIGIYITFKLITFMGKKEPDDIIGHMSTKIKD